MRRLPFVLLCALLAVVFAFPSRGQQDASPRLGSIASPVRHAGVFHVATGTWTKGASLASLVGPDVIYDNTCSGVYFLTMHNLEKWQHRSRIPSTSGPTNDSVYYGNGDPAHRFDERPGCQDSYLVDGFQVAYCTSHVGSLDWYYEFASSFLPGGSDGCGIGNIVPDYSFTVTGLPGSATGQQACWIVDVDLSGQPGGGMLLAADGDGTYIGPATFEQFGFAFKVLSGVSFGDATGPIVAGNFTWNGGPTTGPLTPCTGTDGTIWDSPVHPGEPGTGMSSDNFFRVISSIPDQCWGSPDGSCCFWLGGQPHADFHLKLYSNAGCPPPITAFCFPGVAGVRSCPCGNPPGSPDVGCNNFGPSPPGGTGGAGVGATGTASISADTLLFQVAGEQASATGLTILWQGTGTNFPGVQNGAGVRCVSGQLKRLHSVNAVGGAVTFPTGTQPDVHTLSANRGFPIVPPVTLNYWVLYRNSAAAAPCGAAHLAFNSTNALRVNWVP